MLSGNSLSQTRARTILPVLVRQAMASEKIPYGKLGQEVGVHHRALRHPLGCMRKTLNKLGKQWKEDIPSIQGIVVNQRKLIFKNYVNCHGGKRMNNSNQTNAQNPKLDAVFENISNIADGGNYIYRGEPEHYRKVSSGLYRPYFEKNIDGPDVKNSQEAILEKVRKYLPEMATDSDVDLLTQLRHHGCATNLIDFTSDYLIALFFACNKSFNRDGRVIFLEEPGEEEQEGKNYQIMETPRIIGRVESQKSRLVQPVAGFINEFKAVSIPRNLKRDMLERLKKHHGISPEHIYNDIHGFINSPQVQPHYLELHNGDKAKAEKDYSQAIRYYDRAIELKPDFVLGYIERGKAYIQAGEYKNAAANYSEAIGKQGIEENTRLYLYRGVAYHYDGNTEEATKDYQQVIRLGRDLSEIFIELEAQFFDQSIVDNCQQLLEILKTVDEEFVPPSEI